MIIGNISREKPDPGFLVLCNSFPYDYKKLIHFRWIAFLLMFGAGLSFGQSENPTSASSYQTMLERLSRINPTNSPIQGVQRPKPSVVGSSFLNDQFD